VKHKAYERHKLKV
jgi:hypothetical protein